MKTKDILTIFITFLAILVTAFVSIRSDLKQLAVDVEANKARIESMHEWCCPK